jgi:hypothetical protein
VRLDPSMATTADSHYDGNGQYEIRDLASGEWTLKASKPGFVSQSGGPSSPTSEERPITISNGQRLSFDIVLNRAGAIAGRVLDDDGEPLAPTGRAGIQAANVGRPHAVHAAGVATGLTTPARSAVRHPPRQLLVRAVVGAGKQGSGLVSEEGAITSRHVQPGETRRPS